MTPEADPIYLDDQHPENAIAVFTGKSLDHILNDGGSCSWVLDRANAKRCTYLVCCRSGVDWVEGPEAQGSAFLVGRISDVVESPEMPGRWLIKISAYAKVTKARVWQGWRNPVRYTDLPTLGLRLSELTFEPMPAPSMAAPTPQAPAAISPVGALTLAEAKRGLALTFGVAEEAIEIIVRG